jgi:hypothetical protein
MHHRSTLAAGAVLCAVSLQSAAEAGGPPPMSYTSVGSASASFTGDSPATTVSYSFTGGPTNALSVTSTPANQYSASVRLNGFRTLGIVDLIGAELSVGDGLSLIGPTVTGGTMSWTVTFSSSVGVYGSTDELIGSWTLNSAVVSIGDIFAAGTYTFQWTLSGTQAVAYSQDYQVYLAFMSAGPGAVPLPGAAGLAAVGLVGLARRRRR